MLVTGGSCAQGQVVEPSRRECQIREYLVSSNPREQGIAPTAADLWGGWWTDSTSPPDTSWKDRGRARGEGGRGYCSSHPSPLCLFSVPSGEVSALTPSLPSAPKIALKKGLKLSSQNWGGAGHKFHPKWER